MLINTVERLNITSSDQTKVEKILELRRTYAAQNHPFADFAQNNIVFGVGNLDTQIAFVGEGPGENEDKQGLPFVGRAGQLLTKMIQAMGFDRSEVFITNIIRCRLENNRRPIQEEIDHDKYLMFKELEVVKPKVVVLFGTTPMFTFYGPHAKLATHRSKFFDYSDYKTLLTYHPAYLLRNPAAKKFVWEDLQKVMAYLKDDQLPESNKTESPLNLF